MKINRVKSLNGEITIPGDKSISHRSIMFGSIADGITEVHGFLNGADCISSMNCFRQMGIDIDYDGCVVTVHGKGLHGLSKPEGTLDVGNSGTTTRLISGILAAQPFASRLIGDASICKRPMKRIMTPLSMMGADITEPYVSRNHTELMLESFGGNIKTEGTTATVKPVDKLVGQKILVPGDISSAAYFLVAGLITPNSCITIKNVGINPTRDGILEVIKAMGGDMEYSNVVSGCGEPTADITVRTSSLKGCVIEGSIIPKLIDEIPAIAVLACFADGETIIRDAQELKVKESNRIDVMVNALSSMGADITATDDGMIIRGGKPLHGAVIDSHLDHRIAMSFAIAGLNADGDTEITGAECVNISYPGFYDDLGGLER